MKGIIDKEGPYRVEIPYNIIPAWSDAEPVEGAINVESRMVINLDNASPMVKLLVALLDDPHGISEKAFEELKPVILKNGGSKAIRQIMCQVEGGEGRRYLPENWNV